MAKRPRKPRKSARAATAPACLPTCKGNVHDPRCPVILAELERSVARASAPASPSAPKDAGPAAKGGETAPGVEAPDPLEGLTPKQRLFAREYLTDHNAAAAYRRAGFSPRNANRDAAKLKDHPTIAAFIAAHDRKVEAELELTVERLDKELARCAFVDPAAFVDPDTGEARPLKDIPEDQRRAISSVKVKELYDQDGDNIGRTVEFKLQPKVDAIRLGYQRKGALVEKHEHKLKGPQKVSIRIGFERKRTAPADAPKEK